MATSPVFKTKIPSTVTFSIGVLLFFMPFVELKCNDMAIQKVSGVELATGFKIKSGNTFMDNLGSTTDQAANASNTRKKDPNVFALAALGLGVLGVALSFLPAKTAAVGGVITGTLAGAALIMLLIDLQKELKTEALDTGNTLGDVKISLEFTPVFYISAIIFFAAAYFSSRRFRGG